MEIPSVWVEYFHRLEDSTIKETKDEDKKNHQLDSNCSGKLAGNILKHIETSTEKDMSLYVFSGGERISRRYTYCFYLLWVNS